MAWRMAVTELLRSITRARFWALVVLTTGYGALALLAETDAAARGAGVTRGWQLATAVGVQVLWVPVLMLPLVAGGTIAADRAGGRLRLLRARGATSRTVALARMGSAVAQAAVAVHVPTALIVLVALVSAPSDAGVSGAVGFEPRLLDALPPAWLAVVCAVQTSAAAALLWASLALGWLVPSPRLAEIGPPLGVLASGLARTGPGAALNPFERISFLQLFGALWLTPGSMLAYWAVALGVLALVITGAATRRDVT